jgi:predicted ATPase
MRFARVAVLNWRNFLHIDVALQRRVFLVGPNAAGKSNLLDVFRFLRDVAEPEGGFQRAVRSRGGVSLIRSLHARQKPIVMIEVGADLDGHEWEYHLEFGQNNQRQPIVSIETVHRDGRLVMERPDPDDRADNSRLTQTHLEQVNANKEFRALAEFLSDVRYLHIVPQLVRDPERSLGRANDPYGGDFLEQILGTRKDVLESRLRRITAALKVAVPQLQELVTDRDEHGAPHLRGLYAHWRPNAGWQTEDQFSDGTLRLLGLLWALLDGTAPLLLEEPELSLHPAVVKYLPQMMGRLSRKTGRQVFVSTHSADLLADPAIAPDEVLMLRPGAEGTEVQLARDDSQVVALLNGGLAIADAVIPRTAPKDPAQLALFGD